MIQGIIRMNVLAEKLMELSQTLVSLVGAIRTEQGCIRCDLWHNIENENELCLLEQWDTSGNLESHLHSGHFKVLRGAMSLLSEPCEIHFHAAHEVEGNPGNVQFYQPDF
jgi:quinol monooxygenase YgiN